MASCGFDVWLHRHPSHAHVDRSEWVVCKPMDNAANLRFDTVAT